MKTTITTYVTSLLLFISILVTAQGKTITGTVSDESGPLPGVSIIVKGTTNGTETDFDGKYTIKANLGDKLIFSFVGMKKVEKIIGESNIINIRLESDNLLEEVVVTAYGIRKQKRSVGYSVSSVSSSAISSNKDVKRSLAGKMSGVQITTNNGTPGSSYKIKIRGMASMNSNNQPLYVIDGSPVSANSKKFKKLSKKDIKSVTVLKNSAASSIYGTRGANGVIIINTNSGEYLSEAYKKIKENEFEHVSFSPLSTFSIDVDKAGYSNVRRFINNGQKVPEDAVKIEEMINYFDYEYSQPTSEHPFAIQTEIAKTPWDADSRLVKIGLQGENIQKENIPPSNLVFLIDVSGSMGSQNKLPLLKSAFKLLVNQLRDEDKVSIVVYAGAAGVVLEPTSGKNKEKILEALNNLEAGGSTAGGQGIKLAYIIAEQNFKKKGNNRVILATDGDFNVGLSSDEAMEDLIKEKRSSGVFLTALGFGMGNYKDSKLEILADKGNGNHAYIDTMQEANRVLGQEFSGTLYTIAKDVKIQIEFNPEIVEAYRLIGYENRLLEDEDFIDDTKDAGELGSNHSVTALYEVILKGTKSKFLKQIDDLKYTKTTSNTEFSSELATVKFRYKKPKKDTSIEMVHVIENKQSEFKNASTDFRFATAVALFGMKLRNSKFLENMDYDTIQEIAQSSKGKDQFGYRSEFIRLVEMAEVSN